MVGHDVRLLLHLLAFRMPCPQRLVVVLFPFSAIRSPRGITREGYATYLSQADRHVLADDVADRRGPLAHLRLHVLCFIPFCDHLSINFFLLRDKLVRIFFRLTCWCQNDVIVYSTIRRTHLFLGCYLLLHSIY